MKQKTVSKVIRKKMNSWLDSISDEPLREELKDNIIVTGGSIASMLLNEAVNDYDVYIADKNVCKRLAEYYTDGTDIKVYTSESEEVEHIESLTVDDDQVYCFVSSSGVKRFTVKEGDLYAPTYITCNAITLTDDVQIVTRFTGKPEEIHENYDFAHATNYWTFKDGLVVNLDAMSSLLSKELIYSGSKYPLCSIIRTKKFINRGWTVTAGQYLKMVLQLNELDLLDINTLKQQLIGVDSAYFQAFIDRIKDCKDISTSYLCEVVDEVFNYENLDHEAEA